MTDHSNDDLIYDARNHSLSYSAGQAMRPLMLALNRNSWIPILIAVLPNTIFGFGHLATLIFPTGPFMVAWYCLSRKLNPWNRFGAALGIGWLVAFLTMLINTGLQAANIQQLMYSGWQMIPLAALVVLAGSINKASVAPAFKIIVIFLATGAFASFFERIYMSTVKAEHIHRMTLGALILVKLLYAIPSLVSFGVAFRFARKASSTSAEPVTVELNKAA